MEIFAHKDFSRKLHFLNIVYFQIYDMALNYWVSLELLEHKYIVMVPQ